jgi:hypothetical protein
MKRILTILSVMAVLVASTSASAQVYGWSLSESNTESCVSTGTPTFGVKNIYLWHNYAEGLNMAAADITVTGSIAPLAFNPLNGYLNAGTATGLLLAVGGCPEPPINAGAFIIVDTGGNMALGGARLTVDCVVNDAYVSDTKGWSSDGSEPVGFSATGGDGCTPPNSVEPSSWGSVKNLYR